MFTRAQYLNNEVSHEEYISQFVTSTELEMVKSQFGDRLFQSKDPYLNDIPLKEWDRLLPSYRSIARQREAGEVPCLGLSVTVMKQAARMIIQNHKETNYGLNSQ